MEEEECRDGMEGMKDKRKKGRKMEGMRRDERVGRRMEGKKEWRDESHICGG